MDTWQTLKLELMIHGIEIVSEGVCKCKSGDRYVKMHVTKKISQMEKEIRDNFHIFKDCWIRLPDILASNTVGSVSVTDIRIARLFAASIKGLLSLGKFLSSCSPFFYEFLFADDKVMSSLSCAINKDITDFPSSVINDIPDYRLVLDWIVRRNSILVYLSRLLRFLMCGKLSVNMQEIKVARSVQGPWANLDLPMKERVFEWSDVEEEVVGRQRDIRRQRRYKQGLENYNNGGGVGEGYFWREIRNEPYSWYNSSSESPYPSRHVLSGY